MMEHGKKYRKAHDTLKASLQKSATVPAKDALKKVKDLAYVKFDESVDVSVNLGIDASKGEQVVRGTVALPHGTGKKTRVLVFAEGVKADAARAAGADYVGFEDLVEKIAGGWIDFEYTVATPDLMPRLGKLEKVLGPKGLLPNKKLGTVSDDVATVVKELKKGRSFFKNDKYGLVHFGIGKVSFDVEKLHDNFMEFLKVLGSSKPSSAKGKFIKKITVSSTMGVGIHVDVDHLS
ncbi:50S ribosomal protein L1 [candidate division TM6 bacterium RIFCSPHIGHO2_12_FULL_38_8]|nr:MAG: 50S ribosomal protein L1 [candidate division TM6 bacterium RIFCSPHIGHO2_12_FULL_38_8]